MPTIYSIHGVDSVCFMAPTIRSGLHKNTPTASVTFKVHPMVNYRLANYNNLFLLVL